MKSRYLAFYPTPGSNTAWQSDLLMELPTQLPSACIELLIINLEALMMTLLDKAEEDELSAFKGRSFSVTEASMILGLNKNTLHEWLKRDLIVPSVRQKSGKGVRMLFSGDDLFRLAIFQRLSDRGLLRTGAMVIVRHLNFSRTVLGA